MSPRWLQLISCLLAIWLLAGFWGCGQKKPPAKPFSSSLSEKTPAEVEKMQKDLDKLGNLLEKRKETPEFSAQPEKKMPTQDSAKKGQMDSTLNKDGSPQKKNNTGGELTPKSSGQEWRQESHLVYQLHQDWNDLEPIAVTRGLTTKTQSAMENSLSQLTKSITHQNLMESELAANQVFRYLVEIAALFPGGLPKDLGRLRYHVIETALQGERGNWTEAAAESEKGLQVWRNLSFTLEKAKVKQLHQAEHAITDLNESIAVGSSTLTRIKARIALKNLDQLEKGLKMK